MSKVYMAGPLFTVADMEQRKREYATMKEILPEWEISSPIYYPVNDADPSAKDIFDYDYNQILESDVMIADLSNNDSGTMVEIGIFIEKIKKGENKQLFVVYDDLRFGRNLNTNKPFEANIGFNQFLIGGILDVSGKIYKTVEEVANILKEQ